MNAIIILSVCLILYIIYHFSKDMLIKNSELKKVGGIKNKYSELISYFDDFDMNNKPLILNDKINFYQIGWGGPTLISSLTFFEIHDNLNIKFEMRNNEEALKRKGININSVPKIDKYFTWKFISITPQNEMFSIMSSDISQLLSEYY